MHNDDQPVGRVLSRREIMRVCGATSAAALAAGVATRAAARPSASTAIDAVPDCIALPAQTEGPYFVDEQLKRSDIRLEPSTGRTSDGVPLDLTFHLTRVSDAGACAILPGAMVDIWHCDAQGVYSGVRDRGFDTTDQTFLRGYQVTDEQGVVRFRTIYPGWYAGRAVHVHFKVRVTTGAGRADEFTSQLYFDDGLTDRVHANTPYASHKGQRLLNARDMIFREGGTRLVLPVAETAGGYVAAYRIAMRPGVPAPSFGRRGPRRS